MSVEAAFRARAKEVRAYLRSLQSLEMAHNKPGRGFYRAASAITVSRASAFIMIYNCIEYATRESIVSIRTDISGKVTDFESLIEHWREEIIRAHFYERLQQGTNHVDFLRDIMRFMPGQLTWKSESHELPFPGNIDQSELLRFVKRIGYRWKPPKRSLGGTDLNLIRQMRNDLAHGKQTFEDVGALYSTQDIVEKFDRIREFMISFLRAVDRYKVKQLYQRR